MLLGNIVAFPHSVAAGPSNTYVQPAVHFDGTTTLVATQGNMPVASGTTGRAMTLSFWYRRGTSGGSLFRTFTSKFVVALGSSVSVTMQNSSSVTVMARSSTFGVAADGLFHHFLLSWDTSTPVFKCFIDGVDATPTTGTLTQFGNPQMSDGDWAISPYQGGGTANSTSINAPFDGCIADLWMRQTYLDISQPANRALWRDDDGKPIDLGTGTLANGWTPHTFLRGTPEQFTSSRFSVTKGVLTTCV